MIEVKIEKLMKTFGGLVALDKVSLTVQSGEFFFLIGPSGCGKTTLLRSIAGLSALDSGEIYFEGERVTQLPVHKRKAGMMFQSYTLWPHKTVEENVAFGLEQQKLPKNEIRQRTLVALESVRLNNCALRMPNELSGGQQQRVALARALVVRPQCLLLDEPLSNLDAELRYEMRIEIRDICRKHQLTTLYVTHDQKEALSMADRIAVMKEGRIVQIGKPEEIYKRPVNRFVANFITETNFIEGKVKRADAGTALVETENGEFLGLTNPDDTVNDGDKVYLSIRPECIRIEDFKPEENYLEGTIEDIIYMGELAHYIFKSGAIQLKIAELNSKRLSISKDKTVYAYIDMEDLLVLKF